MMCHNQFSRYLVFGLKILQSI
ncbi:hypothetical protein NMYAN_30038 [Nitrosomonas nitrosa]|uniref:Uncharacterized protein n=1 Tax=Nitrosomonas nitrosa TaxID=52442 RepID=A0A8H8Z013_9PROT|nr:hypothetical protein NMYAN_30038 [Nitrosomonas nitrosa]